MNKVFICTAMLLLALIGCAPRVTRAPELVYAAGANQVYPEVIKLISTAEPLRFSNGWIITSTDRAGGFITANSASTSLLGIPNGDHETLSVVISQKSPKQTAVVVQGSPGSRPLANTIVNSLDSRFGVVRQETQVAQSGDGTYTDAEGNVWLTPPEDNN